LPITFGSWEILFRNHSDYRTDQKNISQQEHTEEYAMRWTPKVQNLRCWGAVAYAENFHEGSFIQWHMVVICIWCALFVTSQYDVIFMFINQRFGEVC